MIQDHPTNVKIKTRIEEVLAVLGRSDPGLSLKQISFDVRKESGQADLRDPDGTWEITFSDGNARQLPLTFEEKYDADSDHSEKLKAAILRCLT